VRRYRQIAEYSKLRHVTCGAFYDSEGTSLPIIFTADDSTALQQISVIRQL
jgi:hypothetical protein